MFAKLSNYNVPTVRKLSDVEKVLRHCPFLYCGNGMVDYLDVRFADLLAAQVR